MLVNRIQKNLSDLKNDGRGALLPYLTAGFPDVEMTRRLILVADKAGAACVEIGFPFSDSLADGPVIQESFHHALSKDWSVAQAMQLITEVRPMVKCGLIAMVSYSILYRHDLGTFLENAVAAGFDGLIVPDIPSEEAEPVSTACERMGLCYIGLIAPSTSPARRNAIAESSSGFVYQIATSGTTGERATLPDRLMSDVEQIRKQCSVPVCVGFGVSTADHVRDVCRVADGAIVGSAIVRRIADGVRANLSEDGIVESVSEFMDELMAGTEHGSN